MSMSPVCFARYHVVLKILNPLRHTYSHEQRAREEVRVVRRVEVEEVWAEGLRGLVESVRHGVRAVRMTASERYTSAD